MHELVIIGTGHIDARFKHAIKCLLLLMHGVTIKKIHLIIRMLGFFYEVRKGTAYMEATSVCLSVS